LLMTELASKNANAKGTKLTVPGCRPDGAGNGICPTTGKH